MCVSEVCLDHFNKAFPKLKSKTMMLENISAARYMIDKAVEGTETIDFDGLKIITVCRLDIRTKGLDRAVAVANKLRNEGYRFKWFVVGGRAG